MNKTLMTIALLVAGLLVAPAARADHPNYGDDRLYCNIIVDWFADFASHFGCLLDDDQPQTDQSQSDRPTDNSGRDKPAGSGQQRDGRDAAPSASQPDVICLACGGNNTPTDGQS